MKLPVFNTNKFLAKATQIGDRLVAHSARKLEHTAATLKAANSLGLKGSRRISKSSIEGMDRLAKTERGRSTQTRIKAGVGAAVVGTTGFLGIHKYHQHKDEKIMARINEMYGVQS